MFWAKFFCYMSKQKICTTQTMEKGRLYFSITLTISLQVVASDIAAKLISLVK